MNLSSDEKISTGGIERGADRTGRPLGSPDGGTDSILPKKTASGEWLSRVEVARLFQVSASTVTRWAREGRVPARRTPGGHYRYPAGEILRLAATSGVDDLLRLD